MGVYIEGIEMPKDGHWGTVSIPFYIHGDGSVSDSKGHVIGSAVPVPPHGDLIDKQYAYQNTMAMGEHMRKIILKQIDLLPTVIPAEPFNEEVNE